MEKKDAVVFFEEQKIRHVFHKGQIWISAIDTAKALEYENPSVAIQTALNRNSARFEDYTTTIKMIGVEGERSVNRRSIFFNIKGVIAFCMLSKQKKAVPFQRWADKELEKIINKIPNDIRLKSKKQRLQFTDTLKQHGYKKPNEYIKTTVEMKEATGIDKNKKKDECDLIEVMKIAAAEMLAGAKILQENRHGFNEVHPVCVESGKVIANNTKQKLK